MAVNLVRFEKGGASHWGVVLQNGVAPLAGDHPTTADLIERGEADWREALRREPSLPLESLTILSPVTPPCRVFCQGANYRRHMIESGMDPDAKAFNMFFTKTDASISPAIGAVRRPEHVALLDYEIELALVFRRAIRAPVTVTAATLKDYVFSVAIANDLSARDVQLPQTQFFKGKSYRGFCPIGPWLTVLEPDEFGDLDRLDLRLAVNGVTRQSDNTANLVFKPAETITELSTFADIAPGDVLLTGTPSGCALRVLPPAIRKLVQLLPERRFWKLFLDSQRRRKEYLQPGDQVNATIRTTDGRIDLGEQVVRVT
ncbi:MAG TPA: fumarylacetoacetate hydrolase family protein [Roseiarcus sp.]|jgi:2-keto-4-pentenoate hydratase/2-oxohepta-3-ene-1,7-dioic acid hydratase in catechol pathway|nr:fumarylacetoacetate hydrolase family protein [Roseiarcus sp.]